MIEVVQARSGDEFYVFEGKPLASRNDPQSESQRWCESYAQRIRGCKSVFVLGVGSGFHLIELIKCYPSLPIYVLDPRKELVERVSSRWGLSLSQVQFISDVDDIPDRALMSSFISLRHLPSFVGFEKWFANAEEYLSARVGLGFARQKKLREAFSNIRTMKLADASPLTIHQLLSDTQIKNLEPSDAASLLILQELIR